MVILGEGVRKVATNFVLLDRVMKKQQPKNLTANKDAR